MIGCAALAVATPAPAKTISITIGQRAEIRGDTLVVKTTVGNSGDEAAKSVTPILRFGDKVVRGKLHDTLEPGASLEEELSVATGPLADGRWPYAIAVDYADANLYPFQALLMTTTVVGNPPAPKLSIAELKADPIASSGELGVRFKNLAGTERDVSYRVVVPDGLEATEPTGTVALKGWAETAADVTIVNRTALPGSRYPVFVAVEYDDGGTHQALVSQGIVEIIAPRNFWEENQTLLIAGAGLLIGLWLVLVVRGTMSRKT